MIPPADLELAQQNGDPNKSNSSYHGPKSYVSPALIADLSQESNCEIPFQLEICEETLARCIAAIGIAVPVPYPMDSLPHIAAEAHHHRVGSDANGHSVYRCPNVRRSLAVIAMARDARNARFRCVFHKYGLGRFHTVSAT